MATHSEQISWCGTTWQAQPTKADQHWPGSFLPGFFLAGWYSMQQKIQQNCGNVQGRIVFLSIRQMFEIAFEDFCRSHFVIDLICLYVVYIINYMILYHYIIYDYIIMHASYLQVCMYEGFVPLWSFVHFFSWCRYLRCYLQRQSSVLRVHQPGGMRQSSVGSPRLDFFMQVKQKDIQ